ncbi:carotenoid oxygenase [Zopfia rhizophila CBS 207.26]|uniref:Carotenoid oxygenase n=1 Tax=Zopfia rhizophila CBS 207.26 TaxID=1314779 RepID=A0A6A6DYJ9_9PEZI|nr:carotenoid oxygenase [Zopfia rhizophila CBS 207.26]
MAAAHQPSTQGLKSKWPIALDLGGNNNPCRLEGEVGDLVVIGETPPQICGTFYRITADPFVPPHPGNVPLDGDGSISAFRIHDGRVDTKQRYVQTERYLLERKAGKQLFGLYRNPFTHHPCVRAAVDSTANTNLVYWADHLLALKESALPYAVDPETLETRGYDPFGEIKAKTFTAHPKVDPFTEELVVYGYEAKGLATKDIVIYSLDKNGNKKDEQWIQSPWCALIHDCAITPNFIILFLWPFEADVERMKRGGHHWAWDYSKPATFIIVPRRAGKNLPPGWKDGEHRVYHWRNSMLIHTAGAWEDSNKIYVESSRVMDSVFPFFPTDDGVTPASDAQADFVRWEIDLTASDGSSVPDPQVILDIPSEFPRIDERFMTRPYEYLWVNCFVPEYEGQTCIMFQGLNALAMHNHKTGKTTFWRAGPDSLVQEPIFVPRSADAQEGDGWIMAVIDRQRERRNDLVIIDTRDFENEIAIIQMPFRAKGQIHGNWVDMTRVKKFGNFTGEPEGEIKVSGRGALDAL